jgi:hypothetical protein
MSDRADQKAPQANQFRLARRRPKFFGQAHERRDLLQLPCSPRSDLAHAALNSAAAQPLVAHELVKEQACFSQAALASDFLLLFREKEAGAEGARTEAKGRGGGGDEGVLPPAAVGCAGRRPPCPNGAPLENFGGVARREEAAGASRWGPRPENRPSRRCAENMGGQPPGIFRSVSGPSSYGKPPIGRSQGRRGSMAAVEAPFS